MAECITLAVAICFWMSAFRDREDEWEGGDRERVEKKREWAFVNWSEWENDQHQPANRSDERACNRANLLVQMSISWCPSFLTHSQQQHQKFNRINMYCVDFILDVFFSTHSFFPSHLICVHSFVHLFIFSSQHLFSSLQQSTGNHSLCKWHFVWT